MNVENKGSIDLTRNISVGKQCNPSPQRRHEPGCVLDPAGQTWAWQAAQHLTGLTRADLPCMLISYATHERGVPPLPKMMLLVAPNLMEYLKRQTQRYTNRSVWFGLVLKFHIATMDLVVEDGN